MGNLLVRQAWMLAQIQDLVHRHGVSVVYIEEFAVYSRPLPPTMMMLELCGALKLWCFSKNIAFVPCPIRTIRKYLDIPVTGKNSKRLVPLHLKRVLDDKHVEYQNPTTPDAWDAVAVAMFGKFGKEIT